MSKRPNILEFFEEAVRNQFNELDQNPTVTTLPKLCLTGPSKLKRRRLEIAPSNFSQSPLMSLLKPKRGSPLSNDSELKSTKFFGPTVNCGQMTEALPTALYATANP